MSFTTLMAPAELAGRLDDPDCVILDCRFSLADAGHGRREYKSAHIPGASTPTWRTTCRARSSRA